MPGGLGVLGHVGFAPESSGGVAVPASTFIQTLNEGVSGDFDRYQLFNNIGRLAAGDDRAGVMRVAGDVVAPFHPLAGGHLLVNAFGAAVAVSTTGAPAGMYKHSWKTPVSASWDDRFALPPYTFEIYRDVGSAQQYDGCQTNEIEFTLAPNGVLQARSALIAVAWRNIAPSVASFFTNVDVFDFDTCSFQVGGVANPHIEDFSVTFNNNLEGIPTLSLRDTVYKIRRTGSPEQTFNFSMGFENITALEGFRQQSETSIEFNVVATSQHALRLVLPRVVFSAHPTGMSGGGRQMAEIEGMVRYHQGSGTSFEIQLTSARTAY